MAEHTSDSPEAAPTQRDDDLTRGEFLTKATVGVGALVGAMIGVPVAGMALAPAIGGTPFEELDAGAIDDFPEGEYKKVVLAANREDADSYVSQRVAFVRRNGDDFTDSLTGERGGYTVVSNRCVHLGCPVQQQGDSFTCPCHGGAYGSDGGRKAGPPVRPLDRFSWKEERGRLILTGEYSLKPGGEKSESLITGNTQLRGPGQHTGGPQQLFYPLQP